MKLYNIKITSRFEDKDGNIGSVKSVKNDFYGNPQYEVTIITKTQSLVVKVQAFGEENAFKRALSVIDLAKAFKNA